MKKKLTALLLASMLVLPGCTSEETPSQTAEETTAAATTATTTTTSSVDDDADEWQVNVNDRQEFDSYEALISEYNKGRSNNYVFPLPEIVDTWELRSATLCGSNYTLHYTDTANEVDVMLEIGYDSTYEKIADYFDSIAYSYGASVVEMTDRYAVRCYSDPTSYAIIGITGEENIRYTLLAGSADETKDPIALLKEYMEILEL